jgi:hypothetical protein
VPPITPARSRNKKLSLSFDTAAPAQDREG